MLWGIQNQLRFFLRALLGQQVPQHDVDSFAKVEKIPFAKEKNRADWLESE
jgi:hypothetical protein